MDCLHQEHLFQKIVLVGSGGVLCHVDFIEQDSLTLVEIMSVVFKNPIKEIKAARWVALFVQ